jgi:hypothetical protein
MARNFEQQILSTARRMPEAEDLMAHIEFLRDVYGGRLRLTLDAEAFDAVMVMRLPRCRDGYAADPILAAAAIESAARPKMDLTHEQRATLRRDIADVNADINREFKLALSEASR